MNDEELKIAKIKERFRNNEEFRNKVNEYWVVLIGLETEKLERLERKNKHNREFER